MVNPNASRSRKDADSVPIMSMDSSNRNGSFTAFSTPGYSLGGGGSYLKMDDDSEARRKKCAEAAQNRV